MKSFIRINEKVEIIFFILIISFCSCKNEFEANNSEVNELEDFRFELLDSSITNIGFHNVVTNTEKINIFNYRNFYNGGGVAIGDINNDGLADIYFTANMSSNKLYLNQGNFKFKDITTFSGTGCEENWSTGVVMVDINGDDFLDIYVCNAGLNEYVTAGQENKLFINNKDNTFTERAKEYGLNDNGYTTHTAFFDYDKDGDLDAYVLNNSFIPVNTLNYSNKRELRAQDWPVEEFLKGGGDKLLRNDNGKFKDVSESAGIYGSLIGFGLGVNIGDVNGDNYLDIYVSNDFFEKDYLYINQKNGKFKEEVESRIKHLSMSSMGADIADINNDGCPEIFTTDMLPYEDVRLKTTSSYDNIDIRKLRQKQGFYDQYMQNSLQLNNGDGTFKEISNYSNVAASDWSWGALMFDADNDMYNDIFVCNGIYKDVIDQDFIDFFADEINQKMALSGKKSSVNEIINKMPSNPVKNSFFKNNGNLKFENESDDIGLQHKTFSNGAAYGDLDNDGDLDLVINKIKTNKSIRVKLKGDKKNKFAIGSKVFVFVGNQKIIRELIPSRGFQSSVDYVINIGIGKTKIIDSLTVIWPNDKVSKIYNLTADSLYSFDITNAKYAFKPKVKLTKKLLSVGKFAFEKHSENEYLDFYIEPNIPYLQSREGPAVCIADVNGDNQDDVFVGGTKGNKSRLYFQDNGNFVASSQPVFDRFAYFEDVAATFFDCDGDHDQDLVVATGGNESKSSDLEVLPRLFINDGKGNYSLAKNFPKITNNIGVILAHDYDNDNDVDLFFGSRGIPQEFGLTPESYILENKSGVFKIDKSDKTKLLRDAGNIRDAVWIDVDNDKNKELFVVGEWMKPKLYFYSKGFFVSKDIGFENKEGMYNCIFPTDIDKDGDYDFIMGNIGENFNLHANEKDPIKLFINDFDENGTIDKTLTKSIKGKDKPVYLKREITQQIPSLKKKNLKHSDFANRSIEELFEKKTISKAKIKYIKEMRSLVAINDGKGKFKMHPLPDEAQFSSINAVASIDIDGDKQEEIIIGGNNYNFSSNFTKLDACEGIVLKNKNGKLKIISQEVSGYKVIGEVKKIIPIIIRNKNCIFTVVNNDYPLVHQLNIQ
jgi:enediyne biosynthesis protein E4